MPRSSPFHTQRSVWHIEAETRRRRTCILKSCVDKKHLNVSPRQVQEAKPLPAPPWINQVLFKGTASDISKFHLEGFSLAIDNRGPAGDWSEGGQSTSGKVEMEV